MNGLALRDMACRYHLLKLTEKRGQYQVINLGNCL